MLDIIIIALFLINIIVMWLGIVPYRYKRYALVLTTLLMLWAAFAYGWNLKDLGIRADNIYPGFLVYAIFVLVVTILIRLFVLEDAKKTTSTMIIGVALSAILYELMFRGILIPTLQLLTTSRILLVLFNALLFTFTLAAYRELYMARLHTFFIGIFFAILYVYYPNLLLAIATHFILALEVARRGYELRPREI